MKKQLLYVSALLLSAALMFGTTGCKKDTTTTAFSLSTLKAGAIDMNGATAPNNIPAKPTITATFSTNVDAATATSSTITLLRGYDNTILTTTITVSGATITIVPVDNLASGALHTLTFTTGLKSTDGQVMGAPVVRTFTTDGFFAPSGMVAYWKFEDNANDAIGSFNANATIDVTYATGRKPAAGKAAVFNGTTTIIEIPNGDLLETSNFTLSFWVKQDTTNHPQGNFVIGLGAFYGFQFEIGGDNCKLGASYGYIGGGDTTFSQDLWWNGDGKTKDNGGYQGYVFNKDMTAVGGVPSLFKMKWAHVVCTFDATSKTGTIYINGEKMFAQDFTLWPAGAKQLKATGLKYGGKLPDVTNDLAFGFIHARVGTLFATDSWGNYNLPGANHFKGQLDDIRVFNKALTSVEVGLMYDSEKP